MRESLYFAPVLRTAFHIPSGYRLTAFTGHAGINPLIMRKQLILIALFVALIAGLGLTLQGTLAGLAAVFGGGITVLNLLLTNWHLRRAERQARADAAQNLRILYACAIQRLLATIMLFALGMGLWKLPPLALLGGFIAALTAQYLAATYSKT